MHEDTIQLTLSRLVYTQKMLATMKKNRKWERLCEMQSFNQDIIMYTH